MNDKKYLMFSLILWAVFASSLIGLQAQDAEPAASVNQQIQAADSALTKTELPVSEVEEVKMGDVGDGSRSSPVHLIEMFDDQGGIITPGDVPLMPFSPKQTCLPCHNYEKISKGWHFNSSCRDADPGPPGQPWILNDPLTATQIPLSYRRWEGVYHPEALGLTAFEFVEKFGRQMPGGDMGEQSENDPPEQLMRWMVSGDLEVNCLSCHDAESAHDQAEFAANVMKQNYRWAAAASSHFADVYGSARNVSDEYDIYAGFNADDPKAPAPSVDYRAGTFNSRGKVFFNVVKNIPNERCYYCHSSRLIGEDKDHNWEYEEDVHLKSGMNCVDCHRNGLDHDMIRGYEGEAGIRQNPAVAAFSCEGCHIPHGAKGSPEAGRLGAPEPVHAGIPTVHFEKLTCTACHSGPWPSKQTHIMKTSVAHALGVHGASKGDDAAPHLVGPVFGKDQNGKLAPQKLIFPSFWCRVEGDSITPVVPDADFRTLVYEVIMQDTLTDSTNIALVMDGAWPDLKEDQVQAVLQKLSSAESNEAVYGFINGGKLLLPDEGGLKAQDHKAALPYRWAFAHDVRPAKQSMGVHGCKDCHSLKAPFHFGKVGVSTIMNSGKPVTKSMLTYQKVGMIFPRLFALTFLARPYLKLFLIACCVLLVAILIKFTVHGFEAVMRSISQKKWL